MGKFSFIIRYTNTEPFQKMKLYLLFFISLVVRSKSEILSISTEKFQNNEGLEIVYNSNNQVCLVDFIARGDKLVENEPVCRGVNEKPIAEGKRWGYWDSLIHPI